MPLFRNRVAALLALAHVGAQRVRHGALARFIDAVACAHQSQGFAQASPSRVPFSGLYSQPIHPA